MLEDLFPLLNCLHCFAFLCSVDSKCKERISILENVLTKNWWVFIVDTKLNSQFTEFREHILLFIANDIQSFKEEILYTTGEKN